MRLAEWARVNGDPHRAYRYGSGKTDGGCPRDGPFIQRVFAMRGTPWRMIPAAANGQPAVVAYCADENGILHLHTLQVLTVTSQGIACNLVFADPCVFATFGLAQVLEPGR